MPESRAIVFDLDDTLYPLESFRRSGFRAIAKRVGVKRGVSPATVFRVLCRASAVARGREFQYACERFGWPSSDVTQFVNQMRCHQPRIRLSKDTARVLTTLRRGWKLGVLTNGVPAIQRRKVRALGLRAFVDAVVFAHECGLGTGKPDPEAFRTVLARLGVRPERSVFVGDDPVADVLGAKRAGLRTIHLVTPPSGRRDGRLERRGSSGQCVRKLRVSPDRRVNRLRAIPALAEELMQGGR